MKKLSLLLILLLFSYNLVAQVETRIQKGFVRSQTFANKSGGRIVGARIYSKGNERNPVLSLEEPEEGYFELSLEGMGNNIVYYIKDVIGPKGSDYKLLYPRPDVKLEFTPNAPLTIVMQSYKELDEYVEYVKNNAIKNAEEKLARDIERLEKACEDGRITIIEKEREIEELRRKMEDFPKLIREHIYERLKDTDFEFMSSRHQEISVALESGDYVRADSLINLRSLGEIREDWEKALENVEMGNLLIDGGQRVIQSTYIEMNQRVDCAMHQLDFNKALEMMEERLYYDSTNVNNLCQIGELLETHFNEYQKSIAYYQKALYYATNFEKNNEVLIAMCHNHLGDVCHSFSEFGTADKHYSQARFLLESNKDKTLLKELFDSYLGLGNVCYSQAKFDEALAFYKKCINLSVEAINGKAYWQSKLGIGQIKLAKGDYRGARSDFEEILVKIAARPELDVETRSKAYSSIIDCMTTVGRYNEAIDTCEAAKQLIKKYLTANNTYMADILHQQGSAYISIGKIKEGEVCMNQSMAIYKNILGEKHPNFANACVKFADYYVLMGELRKAEEMSEKALGLMNLKFGKNHLTTVGAHFSKFQLYQTYADFDKAQAELDTIRTIYKNAGLLNDYNSIQLRSCEANMKVVQGETSKAITVFQEAINCITKTLGTDVQALIGLYDAIAIVYLQQQEMDKALYYLEKGQILSNKIFGDNTPNSIMHQMGMGQYYLNKGEYHKAYEVYSKIESVALETFGEDNYQLCDLYGLLGDYHLNQYHFEDAKHYYEFQYNIIKETFGDNHFFIANPITRLGAYYMQVGEFYEGLEKEQLAYNILSNHFGVGHKATLQSQLGVCSAYVQLGQFDQAEAIVTDLSKAVKKQLGVNNSSYSNVLQIQALLYQNKGDFSKAVKCVEEAIKITENNYGQYHPNTLLLYQQLGNLYSFLCIFSKALDNYDTAISIATNYYGKDNIGVMPSLLVKGQLYESLNKNVEAHKIYEKVKKVYISSFGGACKQLIPVQISEANLLLKEGYTDQAVGLLESVKQQMISIYGENNIQMYGVYNSLADAYQNNMQYVKAREYYQKSLDIVRNTLGANNFNCMYPLVGLGNICIAEDVTGQKYGEAYRYFSRAGFIASSVYGSNNVNTTYIDAMIGQLSLRQGNLNDAYDKFQKYRASVNLTLGEKANAHIRTADAHMNMGFYYLAKANEASFIIDSIKAHDFALQAMEQFYGAKSITETIYGEGHPGITKILDAMAQTYFALQQPDSALAEYRKAADITIKWFGKQSPLVAQAYATLGAAYKYESDQIYMGDEDALLSAKEYYIRAISIRENTQEISQEVMITSTVDWRMTLALIYMKLYEYDDAFNIIDRVIDELEQLQMDNKFGLYNCYITKANMIAECERDAEGALELLLKAKGLFPQLTFQNNIMKEMQQFQLMSALGNVYEKMGMQNEAIECYEISYGKLRSFPNNPQIESMKQVVMDKIQELKSK